MLYCGTLGIGRRFAVALDGGRSIPWALNGGRVYSLGPNWRDKVFPRPSMEGGAFSVTQVEGGLLPGPWMQRGGIPWTVDGGRAYTFDPIGGWGYFVGHWMEKGVSLGLWKEGAV